MIKIENLTKTYGAIKAVDNLSFNVKKGELFAFLGLNGAGKSTTINMLCSLLKKDSGKIYIDGLDIDKKEKEIKEKIGIVFQNSVLDDVLSVYDNLRSRAVLYGYSVAEMKERIEYVSNLLDLQTLLKRPYGKLSGGQKRKVDIARALLNKPKLLFLDEPTTGLDPNTRIVVYENIEKLKEEGLTVFLTTHYMEEVRRADNVVIIDNGKIVASGTPDELKNKYVTDILRLITKQDSETEKLLINKEFKYKNNAYEVSFKSPKEALQFLNDNKKFEDFEIIKGDMDDVFLAVTGKVDGD